MGPTLKKLWHSQNKVKENNLLFFPQKQGLSKPSWGKMCMLFRGEALSSKQPLASCKWPFVKSKKDWISSKFHLSDLSSHNDSSIFFGAFWYVWKYLELIQWPHIIMKNGWIIEFNASDIIQGSIYSWSYFQLHRALKVFLWNIYRKCRDHWFLDPARSIDLVDSLVEHSFSIVWYWNLSTKLPSLSDYRRQAWCINKSAWYWDLFDTIFSPFHILSVISHRPGTWDKNLI